MTRICAEQVNSEDAIKAYEAQAACVAAGVAILSGAFVCLLTA